jgi:hypothetical protein
VAEPASATWSIAGEYFENCNCTVACPCIISGNAPFTSQPTEGTCDVTFAFHIDRGTFGDVPLDGLNLGLMAHIPGAMIEGNWRVALYVDERADEAQSQALQAIFSGAAGGTMGAFVPLIGEVLGVRSVPISYTVEGKRRAVEIPDIMTMAVRPLQSAMGEDAEMVAVNAHPFAPEGVVMAIGDPGYSLNDYGMQWDNSGRNGLYAPIRWSNA